MLASMIECYYVSAALRVKEEPRRCEPRFHVGGGKSDCGSLFAAFDQINWGTCLQTPDRPDDRNKVRISRGIDVPVEGAQIVAHLAVFPHTWIQSHWRHIHLFGRSG